MKIQIMLVFKPAIINMFSGECLSRDQQDKRSLLENFALSKNEFEVITYVAHVLAPCKVAQEALEGEKYVNVSLLPIVVHKLVNTLHDYLGDVDDNDQVQHAVSNES